MTPRTDVDWIDLDHDDEAAIRALLGSTPHSRLPVGEGDPDNMIGVVQAVRSLAAHAGRQAARRPRQRAPRRPSCRTRSMRSTCSRSLREAEVPLALVHDEYGHFEGIVTPADLLEAIAGVFRSDAERDGAGRGAARGRLVAAGGLDAGRRDGRTARHPPSAQARLPDGRRLHPRRAAPSPATGERVEALGWRFEVVDLDGRRIDKVLATPLTTAEV